MQNITISTLVIIAVNAIASFKGFGDISFFDKYKFNVGAIKRGETVRMVSSGFLHVNTMHLIFNMLTLYFFAPIVILNLGNGKFILIYLLSLLLGNFLSYSFHKNQDYYTAVGASGAVTGILYSAILLYPNMGLYLFFIPIPIPAWLFGILYLFYSLYGMKKQLGNIGHDAHFGGAIAGYILTIAFAPYLLSTQLWVIVLLAVPIVLLFILQKKNLL